ncbi:MAG: FMN-dependent dehydrogenase [Treponema sp.]|nr:FMN-dependent dehydrogenase [Treponema sp.]
MTRFLQAVVQLEFALATDSIAGGLYTVPFAGSFKCRLCKLCNGFGCKNELPGMGGVNQNHNFILNCSAWGNFYEKNVCLHSKIDLISVSTDDIGIAPVTGAMQNIGFENESDFYLPYFTAAHNQGLSICVGDGAPDEKLQFGIEAVFRLQEKAHYFLKPYPDDILSMRIEKIVDTNGAYSIGMDIDAYNIVTMRNQVHLERKSPYQLQDFRKKTNLPLSIKGVFTKADVELCAEILPDIIVVSNHGGRVQTDEGSTAKFLENYGGVLSGYCKELWVDGGIRTVRDIRVAKHLGAKKVLVARPFIAALIEGGVPLMEKRICEMTNAKNCTENKL